MSTVLPMLRSPLAASPLLWLAVTLGAYLVGRRLQQAARGSALASPVLVAITIVAGIVLATHTSYAAYFAGAQFIHLLLGPATVALAVPLAHNLQYVRRHLHGIGLAVFAGSLTSIISGTAIVWLFGGSRAVALSMAPKAATTPIAMAVSQQIGGLPALTASLAILGGIIAAAVGQPLLQAFRISDWRAHGLAAGVAGSGVAAAQVAAKDSLGGAFAALGIGLNGLLTALLLPLLMLLWR